MAEEPYQISQGNAPQYSRGSAYSTTRADYSLSRMYCPQQVRYN